MLIVAIDISIKILQSLSEISSTDQASFMKSNDGLPTILGNTCNKWQIMFNSLGIHYHNIHLSNIKESKMQAYTISLVI